MASRILIYIFGKSIIDTFAYLQQLPATKNGTVTYTYIIYIYISLVRYQYQ